MAKETQLNQALAQEVRRWAKRTTPEDLKRRGIDRVRSIKLADMAVLIEKAVNRTLMARTIGELDDDIEGFSGEAREEFLRLVRDDRQRPASGLEEKAETELDRLKSELARRRKALARQEMAIAEGDGQAMELETKLRKLFASWGGDGNSALESEVVALALKEVSKEHQHVQMVRLQQHREEIDRLERRIGKLSNLLGQTEEELARLVHSGVVADDGVASIYRTVQGISITDQGYSRKRELMKEIFDANLKLAETIKSA